MSEQYFSVRKLGLRKEVVSLNGTVDIISMPSGTLSHKATRTTDENHEHTQRRLERLAVGMLLQRRLAADRQAMNDKPDRSATGR